MQYHIEAIYTESVYKTKCQADFAYERLIRTIKSDDLLLKKSKNLKISLKKMYELSQVGERKWKIIATSEHLAAIENSTQQ